MKRQRKKGILKFAIDQVVVRSFYTRLLSFLSIFETQSPDSNSLASLIVHPLLHMWGEGDRRFPESCFRP